MSVLFPKVNKPPTWDYRPIYYDPKKEEMKEKLAALQARRAAEQGKDTPREGDNQSEGAVRTHGLHRGSFREAHDAGASRYRLREERKTKMRVWIAILLMLLFFSYLLGVF